jgi:hypothetical protein
MNARLTPPTKLMRRLSFHTLSENHPINSSFFKFHRRDGWESTPLESL